MCVCVFYNSVSYYKPFQLEFLRTSNGVRLLCEIQGEHKTR
jgi:hypothetical protein